LWLAEESKFINRFPFSSSVDDFKLIFFGSNVFATFFYFVKGIFVVCNVYYLLTKASKECLLLYSRNNCGKNLSESLIIRNKNKKQNATNPFRSATERFTDLDKLNLGKLAYAGIVLGTSQFSLLSLLPLKMTLTPKVFKSDYHVFNLFKECFYQTNKQKARHLIFFAGHIKSFHGPHLANGLVSISSSFYAQLFHTKVFCAAFL